MPKKQKPSGFLMFANEIQFNSRSKMSLKQAIDKAGQLWKDMSAEEREPYNQMAKTGKRSENGEKLTSNGVPISQLEKEKESLEEKERSTKRTIESTVRNSFRQGEFESQSYFLIMVNYFTCTSDGGTYVPAELSISEFSLKNGVIRKYHTFINPGVTVYGQAHEARKHADATHKLPLPPNAMGDSNLDGIYQDILNFIGHDRNCKLKPVYTHKDSIQIVESALKFLSITSPNTLEESIPVYSIQYLLYIMKEASCEIGELPIIKSYHISDAYFDNDIFEYHVGLSCNFHEELDKSKYCTQSIVTRWAYMFCKYMCNDVAITLIPGRHKPMEKEVAFVINPGSPGQIKDESRKRPHERLFEVSKMPRHD